MPYYKYTSSEFADDFAEKGILMLGTAYGFRAIEKPEIRDEGEATLNHIQYIDNIQINTENGQEFHIPGLISVTGNSSISLRNAFSQQGVNYPDAHIFCITETPPSEEYMTKINYDACIEISDIYEFAFALRAGLNATAAPDEAKGSAVNKCSYDGRDVYTQQELMVDWSDARSPFLEKNFVIHIKMKHV